MNKIFLSALFIFTTYLAFAQTRDDRSLWHITVTDSLTGKGVEGASVQIGQKRFFSTDFDGVITIEKKSISPTDTIKISCIGYKTAILLPGKDNKVPHLIKLSGAITGLKEVRVRPFNSSEIKIGDIKKYITHIRSRNRIMKERNIFLTKRKSRA